MVVSYFTKMMSVKNARNSNPDVISDLPSNLIENILMCLPLQDAVRTSILSSKWRYKWVTLPRLVFDDQLCSKCKLPTAVYQVLLRHKGPILGLTLSVEGETCNLMKVFGGLPRIEVLHLNSYFLESMAADDMQERLPIELKCLKTLDLACNCFEKVDVVAFVLWLIRSSPNLRRLAVAALTNEDAAVEPVVNFFRAQDCSSCSFNKLGEVVMEIYSGTESELEFAKYLLATSSVLETMHIWPNEEDGLNGFKILKELVRLRRASPKAEIVYHDQCNSSPENLY